MATGSKLEQRPLLAPSASLNADPSQSAPPQSIKAVDLVAASRCYFPRRWILMALVAYGGLVSYMLRINTSITVIPMANDYQWSSAQQGAVLSSLFFGYATTQLPWGWVARHLRASKWIVGIGNFVTVLLTMLIPTVAPVFPLIILTRIMIGVAEAPFFPCVTQLFSSWIPPEEMATAVTVGYNGTLAGTVLVFFFTPILIKYLSWQLSFYVYSIIGFAWVVLWAALTAESPAECTFMYWEERQYILSRLDKANANAALETSVEIPWRKIFTSKAVWALSIMQFCASWGFYLMLSWTPTYLHRVHQLSLSSIGFASTIAYAGSYAFSVVIALLSDWLLQRGWSKSFIRKFFPVLSYVVSAVCLLLLCFYPRVTPTSATICLVVCIVFQGMSTPGTSTATMDIASRLSGIVQGIANTASNLPGLFAVYITGLMVPHWTAVWVLCLGFYFAAAIVFGVFYEPVKVLD